jgi:urocanate hydratase
VTLAAPSPQALDFGARVAEAYAKLIARGNADPASGLGGKLFYAGEMDEQGRALVVAANIAGAATLAASADRAAQKQAIRDGIADFLVTSLDEALRILKNQLRKRETVAVSVAAEPAAMEREMNERGVAPDLVRREVAIASLHEAPIHQESEHDECSLGSTPALVVWRAASARHNDLALLDEIALASLDANDWAARRWLRLAPRYLGRLAQGLRLLSTHREFAAHFAEQLSARAGRGEITFPYEIRWYVRGAEEKHCFDPEKS